MSSASNITVNMPYIAITLLVVFCTNFKYAYMLIPSARPHAIYPSVLNTVVREVFQIKWSLATAMLKNLTTYKVPTKEQIAEQRRKEHEKANKLVPRVREGLVSRQLSCETVSQITVDQSVSQRFALAFSVNQVISLCAPSQSTPCKSRPLTSALKERNILHAQKKSAKKTDDEPGEQLMLIPTSQEGLLQRAFFTEFDKVGPAIATNLLR
eukprot:477128-Prorocentrum_minimum.AAC.1